MTTVEAKEVSGIRVELPAGSGAVMHNIYAVFARQVTQRCGAIVTPDWLALAYSLPARAHRQGDAPHKRGGMNWLYAALKQRIPVDMPQSLEQVYIHLFNIERRNV